MMKERIHHQRVKRERGWLYFIDKGGDIARVPMKGYSGRKEKVHDTNIRKEKGYLYFIDKQGYIARVKMAQGRKKAKKAKKPMRRRRKR